MKSKNNRTNFEDGYKPIEVGIRQYLKTGSFEAYKTINGKRYIEHFSNKMEARRWRNTFHPNLAEENNNRPVDNYCAENMNGINVQALLKIISQTQSRVNTNQEVQREINGKNNGMTFNEARIKYQEMHFPSLEKSSIISKMSLDKRSFPEKIQKTLMCYFTPEVIDDYVKAQKGLVDNIKRCSFDKELKELKAFFNWYRDVVDFTFVNPIIMKRHTPLGKVRTKEERMKKLSVNQIKAFFAAIDEELYRDLAIFQFFIGGRLQEAVGVQISSIDLNEKSILIKDVAVWGHDKKFFYLKNKPKNGKVRYCYINSQLMEVINRRLLAKHPTSEFLFHIDGKPIGYRQVQYHFRRALNLVGLDNVTTSHFLRHSAATLTRSALGGIDYSLAITGHKSITQCEEYAALPDSKNVEASIGLEKLFTKQTINVLN